MDDEDGSVELQHFDGTVDELGPEEWVAIRPDAAGAPEDWSGSVDVSSEDLPGSRKPLVRDWQSELEMIDAVRAHITEVE